MRYVTLGTCPPLELCPGWRCVGRVCDTLPRAVVRGVEEQGDKALENAPVGREFCGEEGWAFRADST